MNYFEQINSHVFLYVIHISEPSTNDLEIYIAEAAPNSDKVKSKNELEKYDQVDRILLENARPIEITSRSNCYKITFWNYVGYSILNESYTTLSEYDEFIGRKIRIYTKSHFLNYIRNDTFADDDFPGSFKHYGIVSENHIINVASVNEPEIELLKDDVFIPQMQMHGGSYLK